MKKKLIFFWLFISILAAAQTEFVTVWKPSNIQTTVLYVPNQSTQNQILFPGTGTNYTIAWEEIGYPAHSAIMTNVTSSGQLLIDFGTPYNPVPENATYRLKVSNGNGIFNTIKFGELSNLIVQRIGDSNKLLLIEHWGNIVWQNMNQAFSNCINFNITATDIPNLSSVNSMSHMFTNCSSLVLNPTINNWNISAVTDLRSTFENCALFNQPLNNWNTANVTNMAYTFAGTDAFNQNINSWNTSKVTTMEWMFHGIPNYNSPLDNWDTSKVTNMAHMFHFCTSFNQPLNTWNTSNVTDMSIMFSLCTNFNQPLNNWDISKVTNMLAMFQGATAFNQNLGMWNLNALATAGNMLTNTAITCSNYDQILYGWRMNPNTPNNINLGNAYPLQYSHSLAVAARTHLTTVKNWTISGDSYNPECNSIMATVENDLNNDFSVYPNPAENEISIKTKTKILQISVYDATGNLIYRSTNHQEINVRHYLPGVYFLHAETSSGNKTVKFIKK